ncbi:Flp pilus assembly protein CpaB [Porphyrobacter sp. LM 6]|uniref:Flp pilus assembly protein CpaB n=1 Tax=Porphyrobacter sp. LM 6 TaxID=1896196 RepID=UPI000863B9E2|nr:Flp pilus assembly protein CpaB [Porphyrobacter sp. LM 6]AOL93187.1 pilus assembly protein CpaB [Porphyrobacter sp. LM 6]
MIAIGALIIAAFAVFLVNSYLSGVEKRAVTTAETQGLTRIVVATQPLDFGDPLTPENVRLQNFPANSVPQGAFRSIRQALADNRVALRPIVPGEPVLADKVSGASGRAVLAAKLPEGMRAVAIPVTEVTGVSGFVRPGDTVDVLLTRQIPGDGAEAYDLMSDIILERIKVLAIDQIANEGETAPQLGKTAVLEVDPLQSQQLALATKLGTLSLALRNVESQEAAKGRTVTNRDIGNSRLYIRERRNDRGSAPATSAAPAMAQNGGQTVRPVVTGPSMTIYRGIEGQAYPVGLLGRKQGS